MRISKQSTTILSFTVDRADLSFGKHNRRDKTTMPRCVRSFQFAEYCVGKVGAKHVVCPEFERMARLAIFELALRRHFSSGAIHNHVLPIAAVGIESLASLNHDGH